MMDQTRIGYTSWQQPRQNIMPTVEEVPDSAAPPNRTTARNNTQPATRDRCSESRSADLARLHRSGWLRIHRSRTFHRQNRDCQRALGDFARSRPDSFRHEHLPGYSAERHAPA
jgi:hypothetical protein